MHFRQNKVKVYEDEWGGKCIINAYTSESRGVAILIKKGIEVEIKEVENDDHGNLLLVRLIVNKIEMILATVYGPNKDSPNFYEALRDILNKYSDLPVAVCGDWNLVLEQDRDTRHYLRENNTRARQIVHTLMESLELVDIWRALHPKKLEYTWQNSKHKRQRARLVFFNF